MDASALAGAAVALACVFCVLPVLLVAMAYGVARWLDR
jgi:hypothetical protein